MKKAVLILLAIIMVWSMFSCAKRTGLVSDNSTDTEQIKETKARQTEKETKTEETEKQVETDTAIETDESEAKDFEDIIKKDIKDTIDQREAEYNELVSTIDSFDSYTNDFEKVEAFYNKTVESHNELCKRMMNYTLEWAQDITSSRDSFYDKYDQMEDIYDVIYDDGGDDIYDGVYDGVLEDLYDDFYDGIIDDAYDTVDYSIWSKVRSQEYSLWSDARSETYEQWSDYRSDVYDFYSRIRSALYEEETDRVEKEIEKFKTKVDKLNGVLNNDQTSIDNLVIDVSNIETIIKNDIENTLSELENSYETIVSSIGSFESYVKEIDTVETFYNDIIEKQDLLCTRMKKYALELVIEITSSGDSFDDKYDQIEDVYDLIYDDGGDDIYDGVYDGILDDIYEDFYDGILDDAYDTADYSTWSKARSEEYSMWSEARSETYQQWSDFRSDVYSFYSNIRSALFDEDNERVEKEISKFQTKIN